MTKLKPCPFCGMTVHWEDGVGIIHDKIRFNCIVDMVYPMESNMHIPKEMWIKEWNMRTGTIEEPIYPRKEKGDLKPCPFCGGVAHRMFGPEVWIECSECCASTSMHTTIEVAEKDWNRRVNE